MGFPTITHFDNRLVLINGRNSSMADVLCSSLRGGIVVFTYGINDKQLKKLAANFDTVRVVVDPSHKKLNSSIWGRIEKLVCNVDHLDMRLASMHAKIAYEIDGDRVILTSANLTSNFKIESYFFTTKTAIANFCDIESVWYDVEPNMEKGENDIREDFSLFSVGVDLNDGPTDFDFGGLDFTTMEFSL